MPWTNVLKPAESSITTGISGVPIGLLIAITQSEDTSSVLTGWTGIAKPVSSTWTTVAKPTSSVWTLIAKPTD